MQRCARLGLISSYWDFDDLPVGVVEDVRILMSAEADIAALERG